MARILGGERESGLRIIGSVQIFQLAQQDGQDPTVASMAVNADGIAQLETLQSIEVDEHRVVDVGKIAVLLYRKMQGVVGLIQQGLVGEAVFVEKQALELIGGGTSEGVARPLAALRGGRVLSVLGGRPVRLFGPWFYLCPS